MLLTNLLFLKYSYCYCGSENFPVDKSLNVLKDTLENVYAIFQDTSEDIYVDELLNVLRDAFENVYTIAQGASENLYVDKLFTAFKSVLENTYVTNDFAIFEKMFLLLF